MRRFIEWLSRHLKVHGEGHLLHANKSLYMGRWQFFRTRLFWPRLHHIATPDLDRHLHDHPASFISIVLCGGYVEQRPIGIDPCFDGEYERVTPRWRGPGSIAYRRASSRHRISYVVPNTWTLFIFLGGKQHWWGFYTPAGKVWWRDYPSCHDAGQVNFSDLRAHHVPKGYVQVDESTFQKMVSLLTPDQHREISLHIKEQQ